MEKITLKNKQTTAIFPLINRSGLEEILCHVLSGNKVKLTLYSEGAGTVELKVSDSFSYDIPYREVITISLTGPGFKDFILDNFHNFLKIELNSDSNNICSVGVSVRDDSDVAFNSSSEILNELNRLVPEFYDDVEVLTETPGKQPSTIAFRLNGITIRTLAISYVNEVFKRVQKL
jgi:hypothetical protein